MTVIIAKITKNYRNQYVAFVCSDISQNVEIGIDINSLEMNSYYFGEIRSFKFYPKSEPFVCINEFKNKIHRDVCLAAADVFDARENSGEFAEFEVPYKYGKLIPLSLAQDLLEEIAADTEAIAKQKARRDALNQCNTNHCSSDDIGFSWNHDD